MKTLNTMPRSIRFGACGLTLLALAGAAQAETLRPPALVIGDTEIRFNGRAQYDFTVSSDAPTVQQLDNDFRRLRFGLRARHAEDWIFTASADVVDKPRLRDLSLEYRGLPVRIEVGRQQEPFGLAEYGSSKDTLFLERPSPSSFGPDYGLGATAGYRGRAWGVTVGAFVASDSPQFGGDRNEGSLTGRVTFTPLRGRELLHLGASYTRRESDDAGGLRLRGSPETILLAGFTPRSPRELLEDRYRVAAAEAAFRRNSLLMQAEYFDLASDGIIEGNGAYVEAGYLLTGEQRRYSTRNGNFDGVDPKRPLGHGGYGAFEVGLRYSQTDLSDAGGDEGQVIGAALNWYPYQQVRFSLNVQQIEIESPGVPDDETTLVQGRVQLYF